jgi:uncharacterized membrane-anchored protein
MKMVRVGIFILIALAQIAVPASVVWKRGRTLAYGRVWKFKTEPVDPVDAIRGRYVALRFAAETLQGSVHKPEEIAAESTIYVTLKEDAEGFAQVDQISAAPLKGDNVVKAETWYSVNYSDHIRFSFDRLWVAEQIAPAAETAYRENSRRGKENAYVTVRVRDGDAALEQLYIDNQPLADYLRTQAQKK